MKIRHSRKALSPVVASIILIAVTVAVSIAVAAWMGALTFNFMATEQLKITSLQFGTAANKINVTMLNTGTNTVTVTEIHVNNGANLMTTVTLPAAWNGVLTSNSNVTVTFASPWVNGAQYEIELRTSKGNQFTYTSTAPT